MASNLATFKSLLAQHVESGKAIPNVVLKVDNDLGQAFGRIVSKEQVNEGETAGQVTARYVDEICAALTDPQNAEASAKFGETVELFATKFKNAWSAVESIREAGHELAAEMEKITNDQLNKNEYVAAHLNYENLSTDFPVFEWKGCTVMGSISDVIKNVNGLVTQGEEVSDQISASVFNVILSAMNKYGQTEDVPMTEEGRKAAIDALTNICQTSTAGDIEIAVDAITGINHNCPVHARLSKLLDIGATQGLLVDTIKLFDGAITSLYPILELIVSEQVVPVPTAKEQVIENAKKIITVMEIACYYEQMQRTTTFRESLLLQGGLVNGDLQETFKTAGGTSRMLAEFIRFMYAGDANKIPVAGIKSQAIIDGATAISEKVNKDIANVKSRITLATNMARMTAFKIVMRDYIAKMVHRNNPDIQALDQSTKVEEYMKNHIVAIAETVRQYSVNFIDAAMNSIVAIEYAGSFTEHLFRELGAAYIAVAEQTGNITAEDLRQVDIAVIAKLIVTFLAKNLVQVEQIANV